MWFSLTLAENKLVVGNLCDCHLMGNQKSVDVCEGRKTKSHYRPTCQCSRNAIAGNSVFDVFVSGKGSLAWFHVACKP